MCMPTVSTVSSVPSVHCKKCVVNITRKSGDGHLYHVSLMGKTSNLTKFFLSPIYFSDFHHVIVSENGINW